MPSLSVIVLITRHFRKPKRRPTSKYEDYGPGLLTELQAGRTVVRPDIANDPLLTAAEKEAHAVELFRSMFDSTDEGFVMIEMIFDEDLRPLDYRFLQANPRFTRLTGLPEDALGKTACELDPDLENFWFETYGRVALTGEAARFENKSEPMNRWFDVYASRVGGADSRCVAIVSFERVGLKPRRTRPDLSGVDSPGPTPRSFRSRSHRISAPNAGRLLTTRR